MEREKEKGAAPLVQFGPDGGRMPPSFWPLSSIPVWLNKAHILPGEFPKLSDTPENTRITWNLSEV